MRNDETNSRKHAKALRKTMTNAETILWSRLRRHHAFKFCRQHPVGPYIADFACIATKLIVEVDGDTHSSDEEIKHDKAREEFLKKRGWRVLRVWNNDVYKRLDDTLDCIEGALTRA